jgi:hypothetical protein
VECFYVEVIALPGADRSFGRFPDRTVMICKLKASITPQKSRIFCREALIKIINLVALKNPVNLTTGIDAS